MSAIQTRIQAASGLNSAPLSSVSATFASANTAGNCILVGVEFDSGAVNSGNTPTDTAGNNYYKIAQKFLSTTFEVEIWIATNIKAQTGNVVTVTDTNSGVASTVCIEEWAGITGGVLAVAGTSSASSLAGSGSLDSGPVTNTVIPSIIWVVGVTATGANTMVVGSGYSNLTQNNDTFTNLAIESLVNTTGGTFNGTMTNTAASWVCIAVCLKAANTKLNTPGLRPHPFSPGLAR